MTRLQDIKKKLAKNARKFTRLTAADVAARGVRARSPMNNPMTWNRTKSPIVRSQNFVRQPVRVRRSTRSIYPVPNRRSNRQSVYIEPRRMRSPSRITTRKSRKPRDSTNPFQQIKNRVPPPQFQYSTLPPSQVLVSSPIASPRQLPVNRPFTREVPIHDRTQERMMNQMGRLSFKVQKLKDAPLPDGPPPLLLLDYDPSSRPLPRPRPRPRHLALPRPLPRPRPLDLPRPRPRPPSRPRSPFRLPVNRPFTRELSEIDMIRARTEAREREREDLSSRMEMLTIDDGPPPMFLPSAVVPHDEPSSDMARRRKSQVWVLKKPKKKGEAFKTWTIVREYVDNTIGDEEMLIVRTVGGTRHVKKEEFYHTHRLKGSSGRGAGASGRGAGASGFVVGDVVKKVKGTREGAMVRITIVDGNKVSGVFESDGKKVRMQSASNFKKM
jgi:hypothetical protein